jgi:hypothetical protein
MTEEELIQELMPTDREILVKMFKERLNLTDKDLKQRVYKDEVATTDICLCAYSGKVGGYSGFEASFEFDENGKLIGAGVYE